MPVNNPTRTGASRLLDDFSLEMTGKDVPGLKEAASRIPQGTRVNVTYLGNEDLPMRVAASNAVKNAAFLPVPHISARRLLSRDDLEVFLKALQDDGLSEQVFVVGGDPSSPMGPYADSYEVVKSGILQQYGVKHVSFAGYPEGHPAITDNVLWDALTKKAAALEVQGLEGTILTQFGFDTAPVFAWIEELRKRGVNLAVRVGVPGPAGIKRLVAFAARFGVNSSAGIVRKYGFSLTNLLGTAGPDKFIREFANGYDEAKHGVVKLHFYTFGGLPATADWICEFERKLR